MLQGFSWQQQLIKQTEEQISLASSDRAAEALSPQRLALLAALSLMAPCLYVLMATTLEV